jgi:hypothetical protein
MGVVYIIFYLSRIAPLAPKQKTTAGEGISIFNVARHIFPDRKIARPCLTFFALLITVNKNIVPARTLVKSPQQWGLFYYVRRRGLEPPFP